METFQFGKSPFLIENISVENIVAEIRDWRQAIVGIVAGDRCHQIEFRHDENKLSPGAVSIISVVVVFTKRIYPLLKTVSAQALIGVWNLRRSRVIDPASGNQLFSLPYALI